MGEIFGCSAGGGGGGEGEPLARKGLVLCRSSYSLIGMAVMLKKEGKYFLRIKYLFKAYVACKN